MDPRPRLRFFSSFGGSLVGAALLACSFAPFGLYPLAWVALVPILSRWARRRPSWAYARELYAVFLTTSCFSSFWLLFHPSSSQAVQSGFGLFLIPVPFAAAFVAASVVKQRWGVPVGLAILIANLLTVEYLLLHTPVRAPWLLMGHTQADAMLFNQIADLGGVLLLSAWVLVLNVTLFLALPAAVKLPTGLVGRLRLVFTDRPGVRGLALAVVALLLALPLVYGTERLDATSGHTAYVRVGLVQPNIAPGDWVDSSSKGRVAFLADLSNDAISGWPGGADSLGAVRPVSVSASEPPVGLLIWPQGALPHLGSRTRQHELVRRLDSWSERRNVSLLAGAEVLDENRLRPVQASLFIGPDRAPQTRSQARRAPLFEVRPGRAPQEHRAPFTLGDTQIASVVGFESLFGEHVRDLTSGADLLVVLSRTDQWGHSPGIYQHLAFTKLRAIESRRSVIVSNVRGVSALVHADGTTERVADWEDQGVVSLDVPILDTPTVYARWGDWAGLLGLGIALVGNVTLAGLSHKRSSRRRG